MNHESPVAANAAIRKAAHDLSPLARAIVCELAKLPDDGDWGLYHEELAQELGYGNRAVMSSIRELNLRAFLITPYDDEDRVYYNLSESGRRLHWQLESLLPASV